MKTHPAMTSTATRRPGGLRHPFLLATTLTAGIIVFLWFMIGSAPDQRSEGAADLPPAAITLATLSSDRASASNVIPSSVPPACTITSDDFSSARTPFEKRNLADALINQGTEEALAIWGTALLRESDPAFRLAMLEALDHLNGEIGVEMVTSLLERSDEPDIAGAVKRTLSRLGTSDTVEYLSEIYLGAESDQMRRQHVLEAVGSIRNAAAVPGLVQVADQPELGHEFTGEAFSSLGKIGDPASLLAISSLCETLSPEHFVQRHQALLAIASIRNPESRAVLEELAANSAQPAVAIAAADALQNLSSQSMVSK